MYEHRSRPMLTQGQFIRRMRGFTNVTVNREPKWRHNRPALTSGYDPRYRP